MKDYSIDKEERSKFILRYEIKGENNDKKIVVKLADGKEKVIPYTRENEIDILKQMENQVMNVKEFLKARQHKRDIIAIIGMCEFVAIPVPVLLKSNIGIVILTLLALKNFILDVALKGRENDLAKSMAFLNNKDLFTNVCINEEVLRGLNDKTKQLLRGKKNVTINDIDAINRRNFSNLLNNLENEKAL